MADNSAEQTTQSICTKEGKLTTGPPLVSALGPLAVGCPSSARFFLSAEQMQHFKLFNYVSKIYGWREIYQ